MFINYFEWFIEDRKLDAFAIFWDDDDVYQASSEFWTIKELYEFLEGLSQRSEAEIKEFILNTLPWYPWQIPDTKLK